MSQRERTEAPPPPSAPPHTTDRRPFGQRLLAASTAAWRILIVLALVVVVLWLLIQLSVVVIPILLAALLASIGTPAALWLTEKGVPRLLATWIVVLVGIGTVGLFIWFIVAQVIAGIGDLQASIAEGWEAFQDWLATGPLGLGADQVQQAIDQALDQLGGSAGEIAGRVLAGAGTATEIVTGLVLTLLIAFFMVKDGDRFWNWVVAKVPPEHQGSVEAAGRTSWSTLRRYIAGTAVVAFADALFIGIALAIVGVPLYIPLALLVFVGGFFPLVGAIVSGGIATLVTLATVGVTEALIIAAVTIAVQQIEGDVLQPLVMGAALELHPLVIILAITIGLIVAGLVGAFLSVPLVAITAQVIRELRPMWLRTEPGTE